jgi:hypothetical protein
MTQSARNQDIYVLSKNRILNTAIERALIYSLKAGDLMKSISSISSTVLNKKPAAVVMAKSILCQKAIVSIHLCHAVGKGLSSGHRGAFMPTMCQRQRQVGHLIHEK